MAEIWKLCAISDKAGVEDALERQADLPDWGGEVAVIRREIDERHPEEWALEAYFPRKPTSADHAMVAALFDGKPPRLAVEKLPEKNWVAESQQGVAPIRAGRFHVRTPHHEPLPSAVNLIIPAAQAFGTGHHATTAGCLAMLDAMKRGGVHARNLADIGSGTGLLAFAAMHLWPRAAAIASDVDPVCAEVVRENAALNRMPLQLVVADGMDHPALQAREPFDLLIANILALPLIDLAPEFALALVPGGNLVLAGLLETQESAVRVAYRRYGLRLRRRLVKGDWSVLWLGKSGVR